VAVGPFGAIALVKYASMELMENWFIYFDG